MAGTSTTAALNHWERCVGLRKGDLLLLPSLVCWRVLRFVLLSPQLVMLSLLSAGARLYKQATTNEACADAARTFCIIHACMSSQHQNAF